MYNTINKILIFLILLCPVTILAEETNICLSSEEAKKFEDVLRLVRDNYVEEISDKKLVENAINGMILSLDPHSSYMNKDMYNDMNLYTTGEFGGIGLELTVENGMIKVLSPIDGSPAYEVGIKPGDLIVSVDDTSLYGLTTNEALQKIRGRPGTKVKLTIVREGSPKPIELKLRRKLIKIAFVNTTIIADKFLYIRIPYFAETTTGQVEDALKKYLKSKDKPKGIILDIRNNPGGPLDQAVSVANLFINSGLIVYTKGRTEESIKAYEAMPQGFKVTEVPMVMLVNSGSASGAEILAGALQDHKRAILLGNRTFGKGSVQDEISLSEGGAINLTTALYYTPSGKSVQVEGIEPDIVVEDLEMVYKKKKDAPTREENLLGHIGAKAESKKLDFEKLKQNLKEKDKTKLNLENDYQLMRALDLLKGIVVYDDKRK